MNTPAGTVTSFGFGTHVSTQAAPVNHARRRDYIMLCAVLLLAAALRYYRLDVADWSQDHSDIALLAQDVYYGQGVPLLGQPSSAALPHSPWYVYPVVLPIGISANPVFLAACTALWGLLTTFLIWCIGLRYLGSLAGAAAALAYAVNPWAIGFSRSIWSGDHRATLITGGILLGLLGLREGKRWAQWLCFPVFFVGVQVHYAAWTLLPLYPLLLLLWPRRIAWSAVLGSIGLGLLTIAPYAVGVYMASANDNGAFAVAAPQVRGMSLREVIKPFGQLAWLATGAGTEQYTARGNAAEFSALSPLPQALWWLLAPVAAAGLWAVWQKNEWRMAVLLAAWIGLPLAAFALPILGVYPHYFIPVLPAVALLIGAGIAFMLEAVPARRPVLRAAVAAPLLLVFGSQALFWPAAVNYVDTHYSPSQFSPATPSHYLMDVVAALRASNASGAAPMPQNLTFVTSEDWLERSRTGSRIFTPFLRDLGPTLRDLPAGVDVAVASQRPQVVVVAPRVQPEAGLAQMLAQVTPTAIALRSGEGAYTVYRVPPNAIEHGLVAVTNRGPGPIRLSGATFSDGTLALVWQPADFGSVDADYEVDFADAGGAPLASAQMSFPHIQLAADEQLITWLHDAPAATAAIRIRVLAPHSVQNAESSVEIDEALIQL